jgi:hypothetical protein
MTYDLMSFAIHELLSAGLAAASANASAEHEVASAAANR